MNRFPMRGTLLAGAFASIALSGCTDYVKLEDYNATVAGLHATDQKMQSQIAGLAQQYDTPVTEVDGRIEVQAAAHFSTGEATLSEQDKPFLASFAKVVGTRHPEAVVTVEGFSDPQGSSAANRRLGLARAQAVADFLASSGLNASQLRTVSYGDAKDRQVRPGKFGVEGADNRRVALAVDYSGNVATAASSPGGE